MTLTAVGRDFERKVRELLDDLDATLLGIRGVAVTRMGEATVACVPSTRYYYLSDHPLLVSVPLIDPVVTPEGRTDPQRQHVSRHGPAAVASRRRCCAAPVGHRLEACVPTGAPTSWARRLRGERMNDPSDDDDLSRQLEEAIREFAQACRIERDRLTEAQLDAEDRRFETATVERRQAERSTALLLARVRRRLAR